MSQPAIPGNLVKIKTSVRSKRHNVETLAQLCLTLIPNNIEITYLHRA